MLIQVHKLIKEQLLKILKSFISLSFSFIALIWLSSVQRAFASSGSVHLIFLDHWFVFQFGPYSKRNVRKDVLGTKNEFNNGLI